MNSSIHEKLQNLEKPVQIGIAGGGEFAREITSQSMHIKNLEVVWIADINPDAGKRAFLDAGYTDDTIAFADNASQAKSLAQQGKRVVLQDAMLLPFLPAKVLCDVTGDPCFGAEFAYKGIENHKHMVVVNIEMDSGVGAALRRFADKNNCIYTEADGDQPSLIKGLYDWALCLGLEIENLGKWTCINNDNTENLPYNRVNEGFLDGSKNQIEMCCISNMTGFMPDVRGMHMPSVPLLNIPDILCTKDSGGIFTTKKTVDVVNCVDGNGKIITDKHLSGGIYIIIKANHKILKNVINTKGFIVSKDGQRALLYRPYHFVGIETPMTIIRAALYNEPTASPLPTPVSDVITVAKKDLHAGDILDGVGGKTVKGLIERRDIAKNEDYLPFILAENVKIKTPVYKGEPLTYSMVDVPKESFVWKLRKLQDTF